MSAENTPDIFSSLLSNPAVLSGIAQLLSGSQGAANDEGKSSAESEASSASNDAGAGSFSASAEPQGQKNRTPDLSGILGAALANPELLSALPKMMGAVSGAFSGQANTAPSSPHEPAAEAGAFGYQGAPFLPPKSSFPRPAKVTDRRSALLLALKPYMSHDKAEMIDTIVRIIEIMSLIK